MPPTEVGNGNCRNKQLGFIFGKYIHRDVVSVWSQILSAIFQDKQIWQIWSIWNAIFKNYHNLNYTHKGYLGWPLLECVYFIKYIVDTCKSREWKSTFWSVRSDKIAYREKLECLSISKRCTNSSFFRVDTDSQHRSVEFQINVRRLICFQFRLIYHSVCCSKIVLFQS